MTECDFYYILPCLKGTQAGKVKRYNHLMAIYSRYPFSHWAGY